MNNVANSSSFFSGILAFFKGFLRSGPYRPVAASTRAAFYGLALIWLLLFSIPIIVVVGNMSHPGVPTKM